MIAGNCHLCGAELFPESILQLKGMPKAAQYYPLAEEFSADTGITLNIHQCSGCGLVQINSDPVDYFKEVITVATLSEKARHSRLIQMKELVYKFSLQGKKVLEVGSGKGEMLDVLEESGMQATGLEASLDSVKIGQTAGRRMVHGYIGDICKISGGPFDAFICLNYLEHLPSPGIVIRNIYNNCSADAVGFVTVPNLEYLLKTKCFYEFVADHISYFTKQTLIHAFEGHGFDVLDCLTINEDNDIAAVVQKKKAFNINGQFCEVEALIDEMRIIVADYKTRNRKVAVWGAGHRTLALISLGRLTDLAYIVDSAKSKHGKYSPVLHLNIVPPRHLKNENIDLVIVMVPGLYPDEVLKTIEDMDLDVDVAVLRYNKIEFIKKRPQE
jgi:2-polyprenyl-3-methyl-5-hydroxy-6-metoxy-1,4-benzoquinol methylase